MVGVITIEISTEKYNTLLEIGEDILSSAQQSNILGINASIESARAGASGRGFGVVAEESGQSFSMGAKFRIVC